MLWDGEAGKLFFTSLGKKNDVPLGHELMVGDRIGSIFDEITRTFTRELISMPSICF
jgi:hypothetical protein